MAEFEYVSKERFEDYRKLVNQRFDHESKLINEKLDWRLDDLKREIVYSAQRRAMFTAAYLGVGAIIAFAIVSLTHWLSSV